MIRQCKAGRISTKHGRRILGKSDMTMQIRVDILGDISLAFMEHRVQLEKIVEKINDTICEVDYRIANLESPFCFDSLAAPIKKSGPHLKMQKNSIPFFKNLHVNGYTLANNHLGDYGETGVADTIRVLKNLNKDYVGSSEDYEKTYLPLRKMIKGIKLSFVSVCENEFGIARDEKIGAAGFNREKMKQVLAEESQWSDFNIVIFHGGTENYPYPSPEQKDRYHELVDMGAGVVVGMHSHCPQGYEIYCGAPIVYGTGNFFFPRSCETPFEGWKIGYISRLKLQKGCIPELEIIPYKFDIYGHDFFLLPYNLISPYLYSISKVIRDAEKLKNLYAGWTLMSGKTYFESLCKKIMSGQEEEFISLAKDLFCCEAHNELLKTYLNIRYENTQKRYSSYINEIKEKMKVLNNIEQNEYPISDEMNIDTVIWGVGRKAENLFYQIVRQRRRITFVDKDIRKQGLRFLGIEIVSPETAIKEFREADFFICTSGESKGEIESVLRNSRIGEKHIILIE